MLALVAVPAATCGYFALLSFVGWQSDPEPAVGVLWAGIALLLLALPVVTGLVVARAPLGRGRRARAAGVAAVAVVAAVLLLSWLGRFV